MPIEVLPLDVRSNPTLIEALFKLLEEGYFVPRLQNIHPEMPQDIARAFRANYLAGLKDLLRFKDAREIVNRIIGEIQAEILSNEQYRDQMLDLFSDPAQESQRWFLEWTIEAATKRIDKLKNEAYRYENLLHLGRIRPEKPLAPGEIGRPELRKPRLYTEDEYREIKETVTPELFLGPPKKKSGDTWWWLCPIHNEKSPSFCWFNRKGKKRGYKCFSCQASGGIFDLYMHLHKVDFVEAVKALKKFI